MRDRRQASDLIWPKNGLDNGEHLKDPSNGVLWQKRDRFSLLSELECIGELDV